MRSAQQRVAKMTLAVLLNATAVVGIANQASAAPGDHGKAKAPVNTALPAITGAPQAGRQLTASAGTWANKPTSFAYQWSRCSTTCNVVSTSGSSYTLGIGDVGSAMTVTVVASNVA